METDYRWSDRLQPEQYRDFHAFYSGEWWTAGRSLDDVVRMLGHCDLLLFAFDAQNRIAGFARVLSDFTFKAMIFDVIVAEAHRGNGLGQAIVTRILAHERLKPVRSFELYCPDRLAPFYEKLGFVKGTSCLLFNQR